MGLISLAIASAVALVPGGAAEGPLKPSGGWNVDYAQTNCTLSRSFGTGMEEVTLGLIPQTGGERMRIVLMAKDPARFSGKGSAAVTFGVGGVTMKGDYYSLLDPKLGRVALIRSTRREMATLGQARTVSFELGRKTLTLAVPQMAGALKALDACETDLAKGWGYDLSLIAVKPIPIAPEKWAEDADYPTRAMQSHAVGETAIRVDVDVNGKATGCSVTQSSNSADLDDSACRVIMKRAKFEAGLGKDGKPIPSMWTSSFHWELPG